MASAIRNPELAPSSNPRRVLAHDSVSLRHGGPRQPNSAVKRDGASGDSQSPSDDSSLLRTKLSSGETSNAEHWFDNRNKDVSKSQTPYVNNSPPFYHDNEANLAHNSQQSHALVSRPCFAPFTSSGDSSEEYRSVIDDLTIENKKLKRKLKTLERHHRSQQDSEKLFEVKVHGLSADKKRELEETLRRFAQGLTQKSSPTRTADASPSNHSSGQAGAALRANSTFGSTRVADSGYGSLTHSGKTSIAHSGNVQDTKDRHELSKNRDRSIQSFLSDIPQGLMPRPPTAMTEKTKKKLVVRRLESIFGGRGAAPGVHQQPLQQQEVSNSAARADKTALEASGYTFTGYGQREALIMDDETDDPRNASKNTDADKEVHQSSVTDVVQEQDFADNESQLEQRPTRPLDLDPYRAQNAAENVSYIRHLGFIMPDADNTEHNDDGEGWVYLNLVFNMAQLHTINVTPEFVKKALADYSGKLELSKDGRKVRWKGLQSESPLYNSRTDSESPNPLQNAANESRKRPRTAFAADGDAGEDQARKKTAMFEEQFSRFAYKPLFPPKEASESGSDASMASTLSSESSFERNGDSSGLASTVKFMRKPATNKRRDDGPIIFYNHATFYTDLSGDTTGKIHRSTRGIDYHPITSCAIGDPVQRFAGVYGLDRPSNRPLLLPSSTMDADMESDSGSTTSELEFPQSSPKHVTFAEPEEPLVLQASGIGGVYPADNLAINVLRQHFVTPRTPAPRPIISSKLHINGVLSTARPKNPSRAFERLVSVRHIKFRPSELPPPSYTFLDDESDSGSEDGYSVDESNSDIDDNNHATTTASNGPTIAVLASSNLRFSKTTARPSALLEDSDDSSGSDEDAEDASSGDMASNAANGSTVDFLAAVRAIDPNRIRVMEREYDAEVADRLADEIPAGSSAATAGGGSGFNSPADCPRVGNDKVGGVEGNDGDETGEVGDRSISS